MTTAATSRPILRLVESADTLYVSFCGRCGAHTPAVELSARVCPDCEAGLVLETTAAALPRPGDGFLVVDSSLAVQAVSVEGERLLAVAEQHAINRHITELLLPAESEPCAGSSLAGAIVRAAHGERFGMRVAVRPSQTFGVRMLARIAACGPPSAALVVLDQAAA